MVDLTRYSASSRSLAVRAPIRPVVGGALVLALALLWASCSGSQSPFSVDESSIAQRFLPRVRSVPHHPDSLKAVEIEEKENTIDLQMESSLESMYRDWSSTWESQSSRSSSDELSYRSFATLWSLDLSVASLQTDVGLEGLTKDLALQRIQERKAEYDSTLQIDVYRYQGSPPVSGSISETQISGPGHRITLRDDQGNQYRPIRSDSSPIREGFILGGSALYRRNIFVFDRIVEGKDILNNVSELRLWVRESFGNDYYFTWSFDQVNAISSSP